MLCPVATGELPAEAQHLFGRLEDPDSEIEAGAVGGHPGGRRGRVGARQGLGRRVGRRRVRDRLRHRIRVGRQLR